MTEDREVGVLRKETLEKRRVAKSVPFILSHVFLERYSTAGIASILVLFLNLKLGYDKNTSTAIYHSYVFLAYFFSIIGSIIADSWWGQFKTLFWMSIVFAGGGLIIAIGTISSLKLPITFFSITGLVIVTVGSGCIKPCSNTYGGDQYKSHELKSLALFFSLNYFVFNCGSIVSRFVNPIFREDIKCLGSEDCYVLAFGIPGAFMLLAALILLAGKRFSVSLKAKGNTLIHLVKCVKHAISEKIRQRKSITTKNHWLEYGEEKFGAQMIHETKMVLNVLVLFPPLPLFWALFDQQGSRWTFQATRMNGALGSFVLKPDQLPAINPLLVLLLLPVFEYVFYPLLAKLGIKSPLQKATLGGVLAGCSFIISALVEIQISKSFVHMAWLIPQYFVMTLGEILITVPLMEFSYTEAPESMKSVLQAFRLLTIAFGNLIVVIVAGTNIVESQFYEFLLFACLMFVDMLIFGFLAKRYKPLKQLNSD